MKYSDFVQRAFYLQGEKFDITGYPYLEAIYNTTARRLLLCTARQVAKSTTLASLLVSNAVLGPNSSQVLVSPLAEQAVQFSTTRLKDFLESPLIKQGYFSGANVIDQVLRKQLSNNSVIMLGYAQRTADRLRGRSIVSSHRADGTIIPAILGFDESFVPGTLVETSEGPKAIAHVCPGELVLTNGPSGCEFKPVVRTLDHGAKLTWTLTFSDGREITLTAGSRLATTKGWVYVNDIVDAIDVSSDGAVDWNPDGRRVHLENHEECQNSIHTRSRPGGIYLPKGSGTTGAAEDGAEETTERGLREHLVCIRDSDGREAEFIVRDLHATSGREGDESCDVTSPGIDGSVLAHVGSLLADGRCRAARQDLDAYSHGRFYAARGRADGLVAIVERPRGDDLPKQEVLTRVRGTFFF